MMMNETNISIQMNENGSKSSLTGRQSAPQIDGPSICFFDYDKHVLK
jgi:hypothetical protein